eukprot:2300527-Rhodomonas_salina.6
MALTWTFAQKLEDEIAFHRNLVLSLKTATLPADKIIEITSASNFTQPLDSVREEGESPYRSPHAVVKDDGKDDKTQAKRTLWTSAKPPGAPAEDGANETSQAPCGPRRSSEEERAQAQQKPPVASREISLSPKRAMFPSVVQPSGEVRHDGREQSAAPDRAAARHLFVRVASLPRMLRFAFGCTLPSADVGHAPTRIASSQFLTIRVTN